MHHMVDRDQENPVCGSCGTANNNEAKCCRKCGTARHKLEAVSDRAIFFNRVKYIAATPTFLAVFIGTWLCFTTTLILFTYYYMNMPFVCWSWTCLVVFLIGMAAALNYLVGTSGQIAMSLAKGCFIAVVLGNVLGLYVYDTASIFPMFYDHARKYTNVVSSEPSAAVADAGKITFNGATRVDLTKSVGYIAESGIMYCVAPVVDDSKQPRIEYWAAGIDCCAVSGDFWCDASGNSEAQGGVVIFDNNGWFSPSRFPFYQKARAKAEARFALQSVGEPIFVRWVERDNLDYLHDYYGNRASLNVLGMMFVFMIMSALLSFGMWEPRC